MQASLFTMGMVLIIIGIAIRLAFGVSFEDPFAFITLAPSLELSINLQESGEYLIKFVSSGIWIAGGIFIMVGIIRGVFSR